MASMRAAQAMAACHVGANNLAFRRGSMAGASVNLTVKRASARSESALDAFEHDGITAAEGQRGRGRGARAIHHHDSSSIKQRPQTTLFQLGFRSSQSSTPASSSLTSSRFDINRRFLRRR
jgi:hypothetical protein